MDLTLAGFIALGTLITGLFAWLRQNIRELRKDMDSKIGSLSAVQTTGMLRRWQRPERFLHRIYRYFSF